MQSVLSYNESELKRGCLKEDLRQGYNVWVDLVDPTETELRNVQEAFHLNAKSFEQYANKSKKPQIRILDTHTFTLFLDMKYSDSNVLVSEPVYIYLGRGWLLTIHSKKVDLE